MEQIHEWFPVTQEDGIWTLTLDAPDNNIMTPDFFEYYEQTAAAIEKAAQTEKIKGIIIRGKNRQFSVGAELSHLTSRTLQSNEESGAKNYDEIPVPEWHLYQKKMIQIWNKMPFPVVAAVNGFCIGSGCELAIACHYRVCEPNARVGQPESTFGLLPALGGIARTIQVTGIQNAINLVYSGSLISAEHAKAMKWADIITEKKQSPIIAKKLITWINEQPGEFNVNRLDEYLDGFLSQQNKQV